MIHKVDGRLEVRGAMTLPTATPLLAAGSAALDNAETTFDLSAVDAVDSSSIAVILGWFRQAQRLGKTIRIIHPPQDLLSLAELYGDTELLPLRNEG